MKKLLTIAIIIFKFNPVFSQNLISIDSLSSNLNKVVTICDSVASIKVSHGLIQNIFISIGKPFPNEKLTAVIFTDKVDSNAFSYNPAKYLVNKKVCITGKLTEYKGRKQIIVNKETQIILKDN